MCIESNRFCVRLLRQVRALERQITSLERAEHKVQKDIKNLAKEGTRNQKAIRVSLRIFLTE